MAKRKFRPKNIQITFKKSDKSSHKKQKPANVVVAEKQTKRKNTHLKNGLMRFSFVVFLLVVAYYTRFVSFVMNNWNVIEPITTIINWVTLLVSVFYKLLPKKPNDDLP